MRRILLSIAIVAAAGSVYPAVAVAGSVYPSVTAEVQQSVSRSRLTRDYLTPTRIILTEGDVENELNLLQYSDSSHIYNGTTGQAMVNTRGCALLKSSPGCHASIVLDFGHELHGGIRITTGKTKGHEAKVRITLGESVSEALSSITPDGATNDHAIRDFVTVLPWIGVSEIGNSGFRFVRIELLDEDKTLAIREINAVEIGSDYPQLGSFRCSDSLLDSIWDTGRHTVKCNMQDYLWDGIKRDRLIWVGDMYPEVMSILYTYGAVDVVPRSLDFVTENFPLPAWMNGMCAYSIWWLLIQQRWYEYSGDSAYLEANRDYICGLVSQLCDNVSEDGRETLDGGRFLDWPSKADTQAVDTGLHALMIIAMRYGRELCATLGCNELEERCRACCDRLENRSEELKSAFFNAGIAHENPGRKQAIALMSLAEMIDRQEAADALLQGGCRGFSTFYGYFMLEALASAGRYDEAMSIIREYWGGMIELGATSFWEDFDISWMENAGRIDELPSVDKVDVHRCYGGYCYKSYRHSLCHGWASGPTAWMGRHILGFSPVKYGKDSGKAMCVYLDPHLGSLSWAEGSFPTPDGVVTVRIDRLPDGKVSALVSAPKGIKVKASENVGRLKLRNSRLPRK